MPRETEPSANGALGGLVQGMMSGRRVRSENVRAIVGRPGLQPDVLVTAAERAPVVVEAEFEPARNVESEARERLGLVAVEGRRLCWRGWRWRRWGLTGMTRRLSAG